MIKFEIQNQPKVIKTDEDIPFESSSLISPTLNQKNDENSVQQKYDLEIARKNNTGGIDDQSINGCNFQQVTYPDPEDSECHVDIVSMRSTHTQRQNFISNQQGVLRRMNSQENILTSQSVLNHTNS